MRGTFERAKARVGVITVGREPYWGQFPGLKEERFGVSVAEFIEKWCCAGPTHHFALGVGHVGAKMKNVAKVRGIELEIV